MPQYPESTRDKLQQAKGDGHNRSKRALGLLRSGVEGRMEGVVEAREQKQENPERCGKQHQGQAASRLKVVHT